MCVPERVPPIFWRFSNVPAGSGNRLGEWANIASRTFCLGCDNLKKARDDTGARPDNQTAKCREQLSRKFQRAKHDI